MTILSFLSLCVHLTPVYWEPLEYQAPFKALKKCRNDHELVTAPCICYTSAALLTDQQKGLGVLTEGKHFGSISGACSHLERTKYAQDRNSKGGVGIVG